MSAEMSLKLCRADLTTRFVDQQSADVNKLIEKAATLNVDLSVDMLADNILSD